MKTGEPEFLRQTLRELVDICVEGGTRGIQTAQLTPTTKTVLRWECETFEYTERGVQCQQKGHHVLVTDWWSARATLKKTISQTNEYSTAIAAVETLAEDHSQATHMVDAFVTRLLSAIPADERCMHVLSEVVLQHFLDELAGEPMEYRVTAYLDGVVVMCVPLVFKHGEATISLRGIVRGDLETDVDLYSVGERLRTPRPTAFMSVVSRATTARAVQDEIEGIVAGMRLYCVASVTMLSYAVDTDSVREVAFGMRSQSGAHPAMETGVLRQCDAEVLPTFLNVILPLLPLAARLRPRQEQSSWEIAFARFCDALFDNGAAERRVASAVMALEALILGREEMQESAFKMSARTARLLGLFGKDPDVLFRGLKLAYGIRSKHVHGSAASSGETRKIVGSFGSEGEFIHEVLDTVRRILLISILLKCGKEELIAAVDSALIRGSFAETSIEHRLKEIAELACFPQE